MGPRQRPHAARDSCYLIKGLTLSYKLELEYLKEAKTYNIFIIVRA